MPRSFQEWVSGEITRLRAEADSLESTLKKYLEAEARASGTNGASQFTPRRERMRREPSDNPTRPGLAKSALMLDFVKKAGAHGVTAQEIYRYAQEGPIGIEVNSARAMLWGLNKQGRVVKREDRYYGPDSVGPGSFDPGPSPEH